MSLREVILRAFLIALFVVPKREVIGGNCPIVFTGGRVVNLFEHLQSFLDKSALDQERAACSAQSNFFRRLRQGFLRIAIRVIKEMPVAVVKRNARQRIEHRIALIRVDDSFYALGDRCSHADYSLSEGEVLAEDLEIECWKHGSTFSLETGEPLCLPATQPVPVYEVEVEGDDVMVVLP